MCNEFAPTEDAASGSAVESRHAWWLILGGVVSVAMAAVINISVVGFRPQPGSWSDETGFIAFVRLCFTVAGLFAVGVAVSLRRNQPILLMLACLTCLLARFAFHPAWDSGRLLTGFGAIAAGIAAVLMAIPPTYRALVAMMYQYRSINPATRKPRSRHYGPYRCG